MPTEQETEDFFKSHLNSSLAQNVLDTTSRLALVPNPNQVTGCLQNHSTICLNYLAHVSTLHVVMDILYIDESSMVNSSGASLKTTTD